MQNTFDTTGLTFQTDSEQVVVGYNPEMADMVNRRGEQWGVAYYVAAFNAHGDRVRCHVKTVSLYDHLGAARVAEACVRALQARWTNHGKLPVGFARWTPTRPVYGSDAYVEYGQADDLAWEARELADEGRW